MKDKKIFFGCMALAGLAIFVMARCTTEMRKQAEVFHFSTECMDGTPVSVLMCDDPTLIEMDATLAQFSSEYADTLPLVQRTLFISNHKDWISQTRNLCKTTQCLKLAYLDREKYIVQLQLK